MSYLVLARKWRPQTFEQIRGQEHIVRALRNSIASGRLAHAYVFTGIRGVGKTSAARVLAKALNCAAGPTPEPCNACESCREITDGRSPDVLEIDGASNTGVEDVRRLREAVRYPPVKGPYRIYIIDEVHMLSTAAFNALLKTLEEPPEHVVFVFATTDAHKIPLTILSRCQQFDFKRLSSRELVALLADIGKAEGIDVDEKSLIALAREADGSVRDAQSLFDQVIGYAGQRVTYADVRDVLGVVDRDLLLGVARAVLERDARGVLERTGEAERFGYDVRRFGLDLQDVFRDLAVLKAVERPDGLVELTSEERREAEGFLGDARWETVHALFEMLARGVDALRASSRPAVVLEMTLLKMARMPPLLALSDVLAAAAGAPAPAPRVEPPRRPAPAATEAPKPEPRPQTQPTQGTQGTQPSQPIQPPQPASSPEPPPVRAPVADPGDPAELWRAVLSELETRNRPFWSVLKAHGSLGKWDPATGLAVLAFDDPSHEFFVRSKLDLLAQVLGAAAGRNVRVEVRGGAAESRPRKETGETDRARSMKRETLEHPLVREALELFDGDVEEVRTVKP